jgi:low affinity Fe/Cu permease
MEASDRVTEALGTPWAMLAAATVIVGWALSGPIFGFTDRWQLVINSFTTIVTFLMVFVIQTSQNRQSKAIHFKLDELIRADPHARNRLIAAERETTDELEQDQKSFQRAAIRGEERAARSEERDVPPEESQSRRVER